MILENTDASVPLKWNPAIATLKISKVPFWFIWVTPMTFAYIASGRVTGYENAAWFVLCVAGVCVIESANCIHNELVDQEEDAVNQPNRASLIASVGERKLWRLAIGGYVISLAGVAVVAIVIGTTVGLMMLACWLAAPLYNWGPRLKRRPGLAEFDIAWATFFGYLVGWTWHRNIQDVPATIWVITFFFGVMSFMKDLPDAAGDERVNAESIFNLPSRTARRVALVCIAGSSYVLLVLLIAANVLPVRMLWLLLAGALGAVVTVLGERASNLNEFILAYELAFLYVHLFMLSLFVLDTPTRAAVVAAVALFCGRLVALGLKLAPRFVEPDFTWVGTYRSLRRT